jgi:hypothetical protein
MKYFHTHWQLQDKLQNNKYSKFYTFIRATACISSMWNLLCKVEQHSSPGNICSICMHPCLHTAFPTMYIVPYKIGKQKSHLSFFLLNSLLKHPNNILITENSQSLSWCFSCPQENWRHLWHPCRDMWRKMGRLNLISTPRAKLLKNSCLQFEMVFC